MIRSRYALATPACVALAALAVAGCGSSSSGSSGTTTAASAQNTAGAPNGTRRAAMAACLKKQGLSLPQRPSGAPPGGGGGGLFGGGGGGANNPNRAKIQAALAKCGLSFGNRRRFNASNPAYKAALTKFVACVRQNGYNLPNPNTSGNGPVFDPTKVNRNDPKFLAAATKCQSLLPFGRGRPGAGAGQGSSAGGTTGSA